MIRYFAAHPTISNILMMLIIVFGINSFTHLNKESFPQLKASKVQVTLVYAGASPEDVEDGICQPLEDATDGLSFLEEQSCDARDNLAIFILEMQEAGDIREFMDDIKVAIDGIQNFPSNVETPIIKELGRIDAVADVVITSQNLTPSELKLLAEDYRNRLLAMPEVPIVKISGFSTHQLQILIKADVQKRYQLSIQSIADLIAKQALELPLGIIETTHTDYQLRFDNSRKTASELANLVILNTPSGAAIKLSDIAVIKDQFEKPEEKILFNGQPSALLKISKNSIDDALKVVDALVVFIDQENKKLPEGTQLTLINDRSESVRDRLKLLIKNGWQGLILATLVLFLFFSWRYTFWIALGLPISFLGGLALMTYLNVSINMISMIALLMAIGILMDDAIVLSESIDHEYRKGKKALEAVVDGTKKVIRGVLSSFLTSVFLFASLLMMKGDLGQILGVLPVVLLSVLSISLIEAFLILPHHLKHSLEHQKVNKPPRWRGIFEAKFNKLRHLARLLSEITIRYRYLTLGCVLALFVFSVGLVATGKVKFKAFPDLESNFFEARILLPQGTPLAETERVAHILLKSLNTTNQQLSQNESEDLVKSILLSYGKHGDVPENGTHLATLSITLLNTEKRHTRIPQLLEKWQSNTPALPKVIGIQYKEPKVGPAGRAIHIRLKGQDLKQLSKASWELQHWLHGYQGVVNLLDDLRAGKPQYQIKLKAGALALGVDSRLIASQLRAAYQGVKINEIYQKGEAYEIIVKLANIKNQALSDFNHFTIYSKTGAEIPLSRVALVTEQRHFARIGRINHQRTVNIYGDVDPAIANTSEVINDLAKNFLEPLKQRYPHLTFSLKGEVEKGGETKSSILTGFALGALGIYFLLSLQFQNYREPLIVMINIPLALIGAIWGHFLMGLDFALPSMIGFVSLAGIVVNDSILLVEFVKYHIKEGMDLHVATSQAVHDRFRAIFITSVTTIAGMTPLLFETSSQALILVPLVTSIVFGMVTSTFLIILVLPAVYAIINDLGWVKKSQLN